MTTATTAPVSTITGLSPGADLILRRGLEAASAFIAGVIVTWLNAHGFYDPNLSLMIGGAVLAALYTGLSFVWSYMQSKKTLKEMADHVVDVANGLPIPPAVEALATKPVVPIKTI